jgi:small subunit ribosomal protein S4
MVNVLKNRDQLCRKLGDDIWGKVLEKGKFTKTAEYLEENEETGSTRALRTGSYRKILVDRKKVSLFYGGLKVKELKRYFRESKLLVDGRSNFNDTVVSLLERRLAVVVYRLNLVSTVDQGIDLVKGGYFLVNRELICKPNYLVQIGDVVEVREEYRENLQEALELRATKNYLPLMHPNYVEGNYELMGGVLLYYPRMVEVYYPFKLEEDFFYTLYFSRLA